MSTQPHPLDPNPALALNPEVEVEVEVERRRAFSRRLQAWLENDYSLDQVERQPEDEDPARYILAQLLVVEGGAGLLSDVSESVDKIAETVMTASMDVVNGDLANAQSTSGVLFNMAARVAPAARDWAAKKRNYYDRASITAKCEEAAREEEILNRNTREVCLRIKDGMLFSGDDFDYELCETAIVTLQILLQASSKNVAQALQDIPRSDVRKLFAWTTGAAVGAAGFGVCLFLPVIPVAAMFGPVFWGMSAGVVGSATLAGVGTDIAYNTGKRWSRNGKIADEIKTTFEAVHSNIKALVGFLGYLYQTQPGLTHFNDDDYRALLVKLDKNLVHDVLSRLDADLSSGTDRWDERQYVATYVATYVGKASRELNKDMNGLRKHMKAFGVSIDPLSV